MQKSGSREGDGVVRQGWLFQLALHNLRLLWRQLRVLVCLFVLGYAISILALLLVAGRVSYEGLDVTTRLGYDPRLEYVVHVSRGPFPVPFDGERIANWLSTREDFRGVLMSAEGPPLQALKLAGVGLTGLAFHGAPPWPFLTAELGRLFTQEEQAEGKRVAILGENAAQRLGSQAEVGAELAFLGETWEVVGVVASRTPPDPTWELLGVPPLDLDVPPMSSIYVPLTSLLSVMPVDELRAITLRAQLSVSLAPADFRLLEAITGAASGSHRWRVAHLAEVHDQLHGQTVRANMAGLTSSLSVALLAVLNMTALLRYWIRRRDHEVGVRIASGASRRDVENMLLYEQLMLMLAAGLLGLAAYSLSVPLLAAWGIALRTTPANVATVLGSSLLLVCGIRWLIAVELKEHALVPTLRGGAI